MGEEQPQVLIVAIDPAQFEKPYTRRLEGVSRVYKSRPPDGRGKARLTWGYPAITAIVVNLQRLAYTYARWGRATIGELMHLVLWQGTFEACFQRTGRREQRTLCLGWFLLRLPEDPDPLSLVAVENLSVDEEGEKRLLGLLTYGSVSNLRQAQEMYVDGRLREPIEHGYRLGQEAGLNIDQLLVRSLDAMQRLFVFVLWVFSFCFMP